MPDMDDVILDHIDLERSTRAANKQQRGAWRGRAVTVGFLVLFGVFLVIMEFVLPSGLFKNSPMYSLTRYAGGRWQAIEDAPANPVSVRVSPTNIVWVATYDKLARFDGTAWQTYGAADFGTRQDADTFFALAGEEVWTASGAAVLHFDGRRWVSFPNKISKDGAIAIAANGSHVWVLDWDGYLTHYDGQQWSRVSLPPTPSTAADYEYSTLAATPDGALWMTLEGLWRYDGQKWEAVPESTISASASILTLVGDRLWLGNFESLSWISIDRATSGQVSDAALNLVDAEYIRGLAVRDEQLWVGTTRGVIAFDGMAWQRLPRPGSDFLMPTSVSAGTDGTLWAIFTRPLTQTTLLSTSWLLLIGLLVVGALLLATIFVRPLLAARTQARQQTDARAVIRRVLPDLPERNRIGPNGMIFYLFLVLALLFNPLRWPADWLFPMLPAEVNILIASIAWVFLLTAAKRLIDRLRHPGATFVAPFLSSLGASLFVTLYILATAAAVDALTRVLQPTTLNGVITATLYLVLAILAIFVVPSALVKVAQRRNARIMAALYNADYEAAKKIVLDIRQSRPRTPAWLFMHGTILLFEGQYEEAEKLLREALAEAQQWAPVRNLAAILNNLAGAVAEQKRYDEALLLYEAVAEIDPALDLPFLGVAEIYLQQGLNPGRALKLLEVAHANKTRNMKVDRHTWGTILACEAWALTLLKQPDRVLELLAQALRETNQQFKPGLASLNYRVGKVLTLRGDYDSAEQQLKRVAALDPAGRSAREAAEALQEISLLRNS